MLRTPYFQSTDKPSQTPLGPMPTRVVVTGIGLRTALGGDRESSWAAMKAGRSAAKFLGRRYSADPTEAGFPHEVTATQATGLRLNAAREAVVDAGIGRKASPAIDRDRIGTAFGLSKGDIEGLYARRIMQVRGHDLAFKEPWHIDWPSGFASQFAGLWDLRGPCLAPVAACATGVVAALRGMQLIREGLCDVVLVGAADSPLHPLVRAAFRQMRALARVDGDPTTAVRPWDKRRSGFLPGEGEAALVLEREDHARARGALPYAVLCGGAMGSDAHHITDLNPDPSNLAGLIGRALQDAELQTTDLDHVNVHGTATRQNDPLECRAIRRAFGPHADALACSANKAQIGHMLGASGAAELAITCLAIRDGFVPPTLNLDDPDPACDLDGTPHVGRPVAIRAALKLSIGFGGHLAAAVLARPDGARR